MSGLFTELNGHVTVEDVKKINKTGIVPTNLKSAEEKMYIVIIKLKISDLQSQIAEEMEIDGECIIAEGRHNVFDKIKDFGDNVEDTIDYRNSIVLVDGVPLDKAVSLYRFIKLCNQSYPGEEFPEYLLDSSIEENENNDVPQATGNGGYCGTFLKEEN